MEGVLGRALDQRRDALPRILHATIDGLEAEILASRLRETGAVVLVLEEPPGGDALCAVHPVGLSSQRCDVCKRPICNRCRLDAGGERICVDCLQAARARARNKRLRQLFSVFLFSVFLYEVAAYLQDEEKELRPPVKVGIFQFAPPGKAAATLVRLLNQDDGGEGRSFRDIGPWYDREYERYTGHGIDFANVTVRGPWEAEVVAPPLPGPDDAWWQAPYKAWKYTDYFHSLAREHGVEPDDYGIRIYVIYGTERGDLASHSRGSQTGRIAVSYVSLSERNPAYPVLTVAHEMGHVLGAEDAFDADNFFALFPQGYVEPFTTPRYPQTHAEVMAVDIPTGPRQEIEVASLEDVRIGYATAAAMGWIGEEQATLYYSRAAEEAGEHLNATE